MSLSAETLVGGLPDATEAAADPAAAAKGTSIPNDSRGAPSDETLLEDSIMSPEASPWRTQKLNRRPLIVVGLFAVGLCSLMGYAAVERYAESSNDNPLRTSADGEPPLPRGTDSKRMADDIIGTPHLGLIPDALAEAPPAPPAAVIEQTAPITSIIDEPPRPPPQVQPESQLASSSAPADEWHQARVSALREALVAPRTIRFDRRSVTEQPPGDFVQRELARVAQQRAALGGPSDPATAYQQAAAQAARILGAQPSAAQAMPMAGGIPLGAGGPTSPANPRNDLRAFGKSGNSDRWKLPSQLEDAESPYMLGPGDVIPAVLDSAINSELPGPIIGHVAAPVYSSTGRHELLIPPGTKAFGEYSADVVWGQNRLLVAWQFLRFPNDTELDIGAMPGTDGAGRAGFEDQVDNHYVRLFSSALLLSLVTAGTSMTQGPSSSGSDRMSVGGAMSQALGLQFGQVTAQLLQKNLNTAPTLEVRNGFRFNIVVTKKVTFPGPYTQR